MKNSPLSLNRRSIIPITKSPNWTPFHFLGLVGLWRSNNGVFDREIRLPTGRRRLVPPRNDRRTTGLRVLRSPWWCLYDFYICGFFRFCKLGFVLILCFHWSDEAAKWEKITYLGIATCTILSIYNLSKGHHHSPDPPVYDSIWLSFFIFYFFFFWCVDSLIHVFNWKRLIN